jgi:aminopeptidase-like protein
MTVDCIAHQQTIIASSPMRGTGRRAIASCEVDRTRRNTGLHGAPPLGRRGLCRALGAPMTRQTVEMGTLVDLEANPKPTAHVTGEPS